MNCFVNRRFITDASPAPGIQTEFQYDGLDRLVKVIQGGENLTTEFAYDAVGNVTLVTDPRGKRTDYAYDALSQLRKVTQELGVATTGIPNDFAVQYDYDERGRLETVTNARNQVLSHVYLPWGGLDRVDHDVDGGGTDRTVSYTYDNEGNVLTTSDDSVQAGALYTFTYDALDRVDTMTAHYIDVTPSVPDPVLTSDYNRFGDRIELSLADQEGTAVQGWAFDADLERLLAACMPQDQPGSPEACTSSSSNRSLDFAYYGNDDLQSITRVGSGLATSLTYHHEGPIDAITVGSGPLLGLDYIVDGLLNVDEVTETIAGTAQTPNYDFNYDGVYRLVKATYPTGLGLPATPDLFAYDESGNRDDDADENGVGDGTYAYDDNNRITQNPAAPVWCHDDDGNLVTKRSGGDCSTGAVTETFTWDGNQRLTGWTDGVDTASYDYDPFGRRIRKTVNGTKTWYLWDGDQLIAEYDDSGNREVRYAYAGGFAPAQVAYSPGGGAETVYDVHTDHLDSPRMLTDTAGVARWRAAYEAFGSIHLASDPDGGRKLCQQRRRLQHPISGTVLRRGVRAVLQQAPLL